MHFVVHQIYTTTIMYTLSVTNVVHAMPLYFKVVGLSIPEIVIDSIEITAKEPARPVSKPID